MEALHTYRCVTLCAVYNRHCGRRIAVGASVGRCCAERNALWEVLDDPCEKIVVVCRTRTNSKGRRTLGLSKPCVQCITAMHFCGVQKVCHSTKEGFVWIDLSDLSNAYVTRNKVVLRL
jgi:hypothetical protein